ncbi:MAG: hypothetical protein KFB94_06220 [Methylophilaceae bacterium]|nr:MAG: hypothetical protein KFB94_06220 [Methylophilaceae bacterium]
MNQPIISSIATHPEEVFLGRHPILDKHQKIIGYELLFRAKEEDNNSNINDLSATAGVIVNLLSQFGIDNILQNKLVFKYCRQFTLKRNHRITTSETYGTRNFRRYAD